jgi:hypothetical protein
MSARLQSLLDPHGAVSRGPGDREARRSKWKLCPCIQRWRGLEELRPALRTYLKRRCRDLFELEDVVQETLLRAARYRTSLDDSRRLRGWTLRIAINVMRDRLRREARRSRLELGDERLEEIESREPVPGEEAEEAYILLGSHAIGPPRGARALVPGGRGAAPAGSRVLRSYYAGAQSCSATAHECGIPPSWSSCACSARAPAGCAR